MRTPHSVALGIVLASLFPGAVTADVVQTTDGSRLVGTIERIADERLIIHTEIAGRLEIDMYNVSDISTDGAFNVVVASGDRLVGAIAASAEDGKAVVRSELGDIPIVPSSVTLMWPKGAEDPEVVAARKRAQAEIEAAKPKWSITLEAGTARTEGNTDTMDGHGRLDVKRTTTLDQLHLYLEGKYAEQNKKRTTNEYFGGIRYESTLNERSYWYTRTELEFDEFEGIDLRATAAAGVGRYWLKRKEHELKTSMGVGYRHESYDDERTNKDAVLDLGLNYRLDVTPWVQFTHSIAYNPDFMNYGDYRLKLDTALLIPFKDERWAWKTGMRNEYNSRPQAGVDRLDNTYYTSIVLSLK